MDYETRFDGLTPEDLTSAEKSVLIKLARDIMSRDIRDRPLLTRDTDAQYYVQLHFGQQERETFGALFLTTRHHLIANEALFYGTVDRTKIYPRIILQQALKHNAAAVILWHNHPSGPIDPSRQDIELTDLIRDLLSEIDVRLLDHIIVSPSGTISMAANDFIGQI